MNKYDQLVKDLETGDITITHISIALSHYYRNAVHLPIEIRNLIGGVGSGSGLVHRHFGLLRETIGCLELASRRSKRNG